MNVTRSRVQQKYLIDNQKKDNDIVIDSSRKSKNTSHEGETERCFSKLDVLSIPLDKTINKRT